jgi:hypothetical protein
MKYHYLEQLCKASGDHEINRSNPVINLSNHEINPSNDEINRSEH